MLPSLHLIGPLRAPSGKPLPWCDSERERCSGLQVNCAEAASNNTQCRSATLIPTSATRMPTHASSMAEHSAQSPCGVYTLRLHRQWPGQLHVRTNTHCKPSSLSTSHQRSQGSARPPTGKLQVNEQERAFGFVPVLAPRPTCGMAPS